MPTKRTRLNRIAKFLNQVGREKWSSIPLDSMFDKLETNGFIALQEDGTRWQGIFCGAEGRANISLCEFNPTTAHYFYLRKISTDEVVDAVMLPKTPIPFEGIQVADGYELTAIGRSEYETFKVMHEDAEIPSGQYHTVTMESAKHMLCLSWYKMSSGRYEVIAYVS